MRKKKTETERLRELCEAYREACIKYLDLYGLLGFDFYFRVIEMDADASVEYNVGERRSAKFSVNPRVTLDRVDQLAKHEALELLLAELATLAGDQYADSVVNAAVHMVLYSLVNADNKRGMA
jgi:hypothetical protein